MTKKLGAAVKYENLNVSNLKVTRGLVVQADTSKPQLIRVTASTNNLSNGIELSWYNVDNNGVQEAEPFATAAVLCGSASEYLGSWAPLAHLVQSRIDSLQDMTRLGHASQFSRNMAYTLFASNLVDYADKYRGMQSVVMCGFEAFAHVKLDVSGQTDGVWTVPPHFIDGVAHLAGFVMNVSDAHDVANNFCVTPGWQSMRLAEPLEAGVEYRSYVKMIATQADEGVFLGDVYIMRKGRIVGMVAGIQFRRYPRILLNRFFSPPDQPHAAAPVAQAPTKTQWLLPTKVSVPTTGPPITMKAAAKHSPTESSKSSDMSGYGSEPEALRSETPATEQSDPPPPPVAAAEDPESTVAKATALIASQTGIDIADLTDDVVFGNIGVDSLMSLVIAEKFRSDLGIAVNSSLFLEYPTLGEVKRWLGEYYG